MKGNHGVGFSSNPPQSRRQKQGREAPYYPEGGWGYVVVVAAFTALMTQMGLIVSMGVYLEHIELEFQSGAGLSGWISSGCFAVLAFVCPLASHVMKRLGCRATAMIGGAIMCTGFVCGTFARSAIQLFVFADIIGGIGASMSHISATVVIGQYFNKRYALANGFAYTGQGVGIFIFPPILQALIQAYGWRGCMLIQGALTLHISVAAALYRAVQEPSKNIRRQGYNSISHDRRENQSMLGGHIDEQRFQAENRTSDVDSNLGLNECERTQCLDDSATDSAAVSASELASSSSSVSSGSANISAYADMHSSISYSQRNEGTSFEEELVSVDHAKFSDDSGVNSTTVSASELDSSKSSLSHGSVTSMTATGIETRLGHFQESLEKELGFSDAEAELRRGKRRGWTKSLRIVRDFPSVSFIFLIFLFETFGYGGFFSHVVAKAEESGITESRATFALSVFGIGSLTGRATNGWIVDRGFLTAKSANALALVLSGGASALISIVMSQPGLFAGSFLAGLGSGWYLPLQQVILRDLVGQSRLHLAYGYGLVFEGAGSLAGGFFIGFLRDISGTYEMSFYFLGVVFLLGSSVFALDRFCEKRGACRSKSRYDWIDCTTDTKNQSDVNTYDTGTPV